jgi:hypothetical protein
MVNTAPLAAAAEKFSEVAKEKKVPQATSWKSSRAKAYHDRLRLRAVFHFCISSVAVEWEIILSGQIIDASFILVYQWTQIIYISLFLSKLL